MPAAVSASAQLPSSEGGVKPGDGYTQFKQTMKPAEYELCGEWMSF